jgi:hypothetical protein
VEYKNIVIVSKEINRLSDAIAEININYNINILLFFILLNIYDSSSKIVMTTKIIMWIIII